MSFLSKYLDEPKIAYFSMEIGLKDDIPTYSGGLGILAGDTIKSAADLNLPFVAVTLMHRKGYFTQDFDETGYQLSKDVIWDPARYMTLAPAKVSIRLEGRTVYVAAWTYIVESLRGGSLPVFFLDTDIPENSAEDRELTHHLYGGDNLYRIKQESILGIAGVRMLKELGFTVKKYHMNEGHASFLTLELLHERKKDIESVWDESLIWDFDSVKELCVFTTHTPVEAGHDKFTYDIYHRVLGEYFPEKVIRWLAGDEHLNMTLLALNLSNYVNGVAKKHGEVSQNMFPGYRINAITNGVHSYTWTNEHFKRLYDKYIPGWANEPEIFVRVETVPDEAIWNAHQDAKTDLINYVNTHCNADMDVNTLTIGFARRFATYKRANLLFTDIDRLVKIAGGRVQFVFAGKAHPKDEGGKKLIQNIFSYARELKGKLKLAFIKNYKMDIGLMLSTGVDVWLNNPLRPLEASGTSGMKSTHNGVPNFSVLDGWWIEGHIEGYTGWSIGPAPTEIEPDESMNKIDADDLYNKLENVIIPTYYNDKKKWIFIMKNTIGKNAYYFNTHRMMRRYVTEAYIR
ncbi:alpha-glucan family phosphorylase [Candidatus Magnetominusculus xianensis]|uniref:Alpha-glucan phosphorylase n=1 Tax=Candidatus Magnetominusculus xianensis TaxID=1748249 RepID=A0ABR5SCY8_9BACT|nr:alpha-glucan family phosphorylase [Candidatus Magnetominusculus xianensis]KWT82497.1 alpha-glucan phosphorylase [Candidatus Magnetominusculus xianensis]MBF0403215.1 alpha-glucan family phosphorylase [Nitrospirota bacterium]